MGKLITCAAAVEPSAFTAAGRSAIFATLNFAVTDGTEANAKAAFESFAADVANARFYLYQATAQPDGSFVLDLDATSAQPLAAIGAAPGTLATDIVAWITTRATASAALKWVFDPAGAPGEVDYHNIAATHLLDAVERWDAPFPQQAGLCRILEVPAGHTTPSYLILPWLVAGNPPTPINGVRFDADRFLITSAQIPGLDPEIHATVVHQPPDLTLVDTNSGFLNVAVDGNGVPDAIGLTALLTRVRERSGARLAVAPQLLGLGWPSKNSDWHIVLKRMRWRTLKALLAILDPVVTMTTMAGTGQEGPFVTALSAAVADALAAQTLPYSADDAGHLTAWVQSGIRAVLTVDPTQQPSRTAFVSSLGKLFGWTDIVSFHTNLSPGGSMLSLGDVPKLVPLLLSLFERYGNDDTLVAADPFAGKAASWLPDLEQQLDRELAEANQAFQSEQGVEAALLTLMDLAGIKDDRLTLLLPALPAGRATEILSALKREIQGTTFNGAEAARNVQGVLFEAALTAPQVPAVVPKPRVATADLDQRLKGGDWFAARLGIAPAPGGVFTQLASGLPSVDVPLDAPDLAFLLDAANPASLRARYAEAYGDLKPPLASIGRAVPDQVPRGLPVQIAVDQDQADADAFAIAYNGVGLLVQRDAEPWAHANLAMLTQTGHPPVGPALHPILTHANDGNFSIVLDYHGDPLARTLAAQQMLADRGAELSGFYTYDDPDETQLGRYAKLPALGYGHEYRVAAFVVGKSGALPLTARQAAQAPWQPAEAPNVPAGTFSARYRYWRTTAIGQVALGDASVTATGAAARFAPFNATIDGTYPLARDYPRIGHGAAKGNRSLFFVGRARDGGGAVTMPVHATPVAVVLDELSWSGGVGSLLIELVGAPDESAPALATWPVAITGPEFRAKVSVNLSQVGGQLACELILGTLATASTPQPRFAIALPAAATRFWLRCTITTTTSDGAVSMPDPRADLEGRQAVKPGGGGLVLLAPERSNVWKRNAAVEAELHIAFPQMSFPDFDRWLNGKALFAEANGTNGPLLPFWAGLLSLRHDAKLDDATAALINQMPDLSVTRLLFDLVATDAIDQDEWQPVVCVLDIPPLRTIVKGSSSTRANLTALATALQTTLSVSAGSVLGIDLAAGTVTVPAGVVAQLRVRPLVPRRYLDAGPLRAFDDNVPRWATGSYVDTSGNYLIFDGASVTIEVMREFLPKTRVAHPPQAWVDLGNRVLMVSARGRERSYEINAVRPKNDDLPLWRQVGSMDVGTQRWRYLGRPIAAELGRTALQPMNGADAASPVRTLRVLDKETAPEVDRFEAEIFGDLAIGDADTQTVVIRPQPVNLLQTLHWETPSATMFRHRVVLRSRYAGALRNADDAEVEVTWSRANQSGPHLRVAMLADRTRLQLTRPQLRAMMPLPRGMEGDAATPPVLVMLEERPFGYGGLAERIGAEVKTSIGYELKTGETVKAKDARKEIGLDPRLGYKPMDPHVAPGIVLESEGPVGLTFDTVGAAPTWANSALVLHPTLLQAGKAATVSLEEHFMSVSLRRYLDSAWTIDDEKLLDTKTPDLGQTWWCECDDAVDLKLAANVLLCQVKKDAAEWTVTFNARFIQSDSVEPLTLAKVDAGEGDRLTLLHQPLEAGRYALSAFLVRKGRVPVMLASVEWSAPKPLVPAPGGGSAPAPPPPVDQPLCLTFDPVVQYIRRTASSPGTAMNWTRTARNADQLRLAPLAGTDLEQVTAEQLSVGPRPTTKGARRALRKLNDAKGRWLRAPLSAYRSPIHVHRHLGMIVTRGTLGVGPRLEQYQTTALILCADLQAFEPAMDQSIRVVEFETPARPIAVGDYIDDEYRRATFDLRAFLGKRTPAKFGPPVQPAPALPPFLLFMRPLKDGLQIGPADTLALTVGGRSGAGARMPSISLVLSTASAIRPVAVVLAFDLAAMKFLATGVDAAGVAQTLTVHASGPTTLDPVDWSILEILDIGGYAPRRNQVDLPDEHWADLSLLTGKKDYMNQPALDLSSIRLDFNWFFGDTGTRGQNGQQPSDEGPTASEQVNLEALGAMREAVARVVSVSPPIAVVNDP